MDKKLISLEKWNEIGPFELNIDEEYDFENLTYGTFTERKDIFEGIIDSSGKPSGYGRFISGNNGIYEGFFDNKCQL